MSTCPDDCKQDRQKANENIDRLFSLSIPSWARALLISSILVLFTMVAGNFMYCASTYATRAEMQELKGNIRSDMSDIRAELRSMNNKLDELRRKP